MKKMSGQKLWKKAKKIIPGGNMLFSKRSELLLPEKWISYYSKTKNAYIWDLDNKKYLDMLFFVGTSTLGYNNKKINDHVKKIVDKGVMSSLNCPEEVHLAEKLIEINPWAKMVRLCRSGGEANAVAIRIARAASGRDKVAICGYHGWHDWYLSANIKNNKLDDHIIPGLPVKGVPKALFKTAIPFEYNNYEQLEKIVKKHKIGTIKMEVARSEQPKNNFLQKVRSLANKHNIILIFDECTSGFRQTYGGMHKLYNVEPDLAMFGKALGNGYAITAVVGKKEVMDYAQDSFISSTFWTERIGPAAAIKTLEVMKEVKSWEILPKVGNKIIKSWSDIFRNTNLDCNIFGTPAIPCFSFKGKNSQKYKTIFTDLMLKRNILASNVVFTSTAHDNKNILDNYLNNFYDVINIIAKINKKKLDIKKYLKTPVCHSGFARLN
jgi:glutamate-1-semialdehyde 2,1-aminomutase